MPNAPAFLDLLRETPELWKATAIALVSLPWILIILWILASRILWGPKHGRKKNRTRRQNRKTMTIAEVETTTDYQAATPKQRAALDKLDHTTKLVHEKDFGEHAISVARDMIGNEHCNRWPYRNIDLEDATEDLRASYASIEIGRSTYYYYYYYPRSEADDPKPDFHDLRP